MLHNYLIIVIRVLTKRKLFSIINSLGLGIAIGFSILVFMFIRDEQAFDQFHADMERVFLLKSTSLDSPAFSRGEPAPYYTMAIVSSGLVDALKENVPEVQDITLMKQSTGVVKFKEKMFDQPVLFVDAFFFKVLSFPVVAGASDIVLDQPEDLVLSESTALKYFGQTNVIGETIELSMNDIDITNYVIRAVVKVPTVSSLQFEMLVPLNNYSYLFPKNWGSRSYSSFVKLRAGSNVGNFKTKADTLIAQNRSAYFDKVRNETGIPKEMVIDELTYTPMESVHFDKDARLGVTPSDERHSWILSGIAFLIIIIASINYISFALASAAKRRKEIGIRKTIGASGIDIFKQFNVESLGQAAFASLIGLVIAIVFLPTFNILTGKEIEFTAENILPVLFVTIALVILVGLFSGSYPALQVARFKPAVVLRSASALRSSLMKPLVVLQFSLSAFLMISGIIMYRQMRYIATSDLGFNDQAIIAIPTNIGWNEESDRAIERFRQKVSNESAIENVSGTVSSFAKGRMSQTISLGNQDITVYMNKGDDQYLELFEIPLLTGRNFVLGMPSDSNAVLVNEALVKAFGWSDPTSEILMPNENPKSWKNVIGVMKDFHFEGLDQEIKPLFLTSPTGDFHMITLLVKLNTSNIPTALITAQKAWRELYPDKPFNYSFVDDDVAQQYESYSRWMKITGIATIIAIVIASLGLFGLAGIQAVNKTKEIGIRKVLGADISSLVIMLNRPFFFMAIIAFILATPVSWYVMNQWIANFKYHIPIGWELFGISALCGILTAMISVSYHGVKTAYTNPAEILKIE